MGNCTDETNMNHKTTLYMVKLLFLLTKMLTERGVQNECVNFAEHNCTANTAGSNHFVDKLHLTSYKVRRATFKACKHAKEGRVK